MSEKRGNSISIYANKHLFSLIQKNCIIKKKRGIRDFLSGSLAYSDYLA